jgi:non-ribosomal peptide synthase protein (TIGR01720 family)
VWVDLSEMSEAEQVREIEEQSKEYQASLDLEAGPLVRVVYYEMGGRQADRLLLVAHHLVVDGVSWRILLEDLQTAYRQARDGQEVKLPLKTSAYRTWAERLEAYAQTEELEKEKGYWLGEVRRGVRPIPVDNPAGRDENLVGTAEQVRVALGVEETKALLHAVPPVYNTQIQEVLLTALVEACLRWSGSNRLLVDLEGHGRVELFGDLDLTRTVGWFTSLYPVVLTKPVGSGVGQAMMAVKEEMRGVPHEGIGYGILRYLGQDENRKAEMAGLESAEMSFNYLGQMDQVIGGSEMFGVAQEDTGLPFSPLGKRAHLVELNALVVAQSLRLNWTYSPAVHKRETITRLAEDYLAALTAIITHCQSPEAGGYTPSDFPGAKLNQKDLDRFLSKLKKSGTR